MSEREFKKALRERINRTPGLRCWAQPAGMLKVGNRCVHLAPKGAADLTGIWSPHGIRFELETKADARAKTARADEAPQDAWREMIRGAGGVYVNAKQMPGEDTATAVERTVATLQADLAEALSRRECSAAEAAVAEQVAWGGVAGEEEAL